MSRPARSFLIDSTSVGIKPALAILTDKQFEQQPQTREYALLVVAKFGDRSHLNVLDPLLSDTSSSDGSSSFNLFGIKAGRTWTGDSVTRATLEFDGGVAKPQVESGCAVAACCGQLPFVAKRGSCEQVTGRCAN